MENEEVNALMQDFQRHLAAAKSAVVREGVFFSRLVNGLEYEPSLEVPDFATDGVRVLLNPIWFTRVCNAGQRKTTIASCILHTALEHPFRRGRRDPALWSRSAEVVVNHLLLHSGFDALPQGSFPCPFLPHHLAGAATERVYKHLWEEDPPEQEQQCAGMGLGSGSNRLPSSGGKKGAPQDPGDPDPSGGKSNGESEDDDDPADDQQGDGDGEQEDQQDGGEEDKGRGDDEDEDEDEDGQGNGDGEDEDDEEEEDGEGDGGEDKKKRHQSLFDSPERTKEGAEERRSENRKAALQAAAMGEGWGDTPGEIIQAVRELGAVLPTTAEQVKKVLSEASKGDYSFRRPNRAHIARDIYLPSLTNKERGKIVFAVDTSGSVDDETVAQFLEQGISLCADLNVDIICIQCDSRVQHVEEVQAGATLLDKRVYGRGGTAYRPVFDWISANLQDNVDAVVYATDGDCWDWVSTPPYPLFWLIPEALTTRNPANGALASLHACHRARGGGQYSHGNILFEGETIAMDETLRVAY